jgi:hypothetical protein
VFEGVTWNSNRILNFDFLFKIFLFFCQKFIRLVFWILTNFYIRLNLIWLFLIILWLELIIRYGSHIWICLILLIFKLIIKDFIILFIKDVIIFKGLHIVLELLLWALVSLVYLVDLILESLIKFFQSWFCHFWFNHSRSITGWGVFLLILVIKISLSPLNIFSNYTL